MPRQVWDYSNPVSITFGEGSIASVHEAVNGRTYCLLTYSDHPLFDGLVERISCEAGQPAVVIRDVDPNPTFEGLREACHRFAAATTAPQVIVAVGGGSVIDTAKVLSAAAGDFNLVQAYLEGQSSAESLRRVPIVAIPTTAGTGSEVTCWATVWDANAKKKYSLAGRSLYPERALVDPALSLDVPRCLTLSTGLDALSHALESIWNVNANPVSTNHAVYAAREILAALPALLDRLGDLPLRSRMARASLSAGLAFSNTKTALAHSLSYPLTLHHGIVHGIACAFSLPTVMRGAIGFDADCDDALKRIFGPDLERGAGKLEDFLLLLGVSTRPTEYGITHENWVQAIRQALEGERGKNFIGNSDAVLAAAA